MQRRHAKLKRRERRRELQACIALLALFGGLFAAGYTWQSLAQPKSAKSTAARSGAQVEAELRTGAILFVPMQGNVCRKLLIDNETWQIRDGGQAVCDEAVSWNSNVPAGAYSPTPRADALRTVFGARQ